MYDEYMQSDQVTRDMQPKGRLPVDVRRILLTKWAARAWRHLEAEREEEEANAAREERDPNTLFWRAFSRTGCLVTSDGTRDDEIRPHHSLNDDAALMAGFKSSIHSPEQIRNKRYVPAGADLENDEIIIVLSDSEAENSEDVDDDFPEDPEDDDGAREPLPHADDDRFELGFVEDEGAQIANAREQIGDDQEQLMDFNFAARVQRESASVGDAYVEAQPTRYGRKRRKRQLQPS